MEASAKKADQVEGGLVQEALLVCPQALRQPLGEPEFPTFSFEGREWPGVLMSGGSVSLG